MKKSLLLLTLIANMAGVAFSQISLSCATGTGATLSTGWVTGGGASAVGSAIQLTAPVGSQANQLYYNTAENVTACGSFTVDFDFQIIPSASSYAVADGIAFWFVSPLSGFSGGGGIGLPTNPNGLVLVLDTYDNDGVANDPLISLYGYPSGFTGTYVEGVTTNRLGNMNNQNFIDDAGWHHVHITYNGGNVAVYFNYSATPNMSGYFPITTSGYFGFSAGTGAAYSTQSVRNIYINSNTISPIVGPDVVCASSTATYTDATVGGTWSSSSSSVLSIVSTTGVATPGTAGTATLTYAYSSTCTTTKTVTVSATTSAPITGATSACPGTPTTLSCTASGGTWSSSNASIATIGTSSGILNGVLAGTATITYTLPAGCYTTTTETINTAPPSIAITPSPASVCDGGVLPLTAGYATAYNLFPAQGWENGVPTTAGTATNLWNYIGATSSYWYQQGGGLTTSPTTTSAYSGSFVADFNCRSLPSGSTASIYSPAFSMTGVNSATLSFWVYRDVSAYNTAAYNSEGLTVYVNTSPVIAGGTNLGFVPRRGGAAVTGSFSGTSTVATSGWQQYTATIPASYTGTTNYILISGYSQNGDNIYLDSVTVTGTIAPPTWTPSTYLFNDAATTTAYTGGAINPVYVHPTGLSAISTITYSVSTSNGTCSSSGTRIVTLNPNPATITGTQIVCISSTSTLSDPTSGGTWSSGSTSIATVGSSTGIVSGAGIGTAVITYSIGTCYTTAVVTVVSTPSAISGIGIACLGATTALSNTVAGGSWSSSNPTVGTVGTSTGIVSGLSLGTTIITYGFSSCISTTVVTVNPFPTALSGLLGLCIGSTSTLSSSPTGGIWTSSTTSVATVGVVSGIVTGGSIGTSTISYRAGGCTTTAVVSVVSTPGPIVGPSSVCVGSTITLTPPSPGGTWTSSNSNVTIGPSSGVVTGMVTGTSVITYSLSAGCYNTTTVTVTGVPTSIGGTMTVCQGSSATLTYSITGGAWGSTSPNISIGTGTGAYTGIIAGTALVTYTLPSGCTTTTVVTVNPLPAALTITSGTNPACPGSTFVISCASGGGSWVSSDPTVASIDATGLVTAVNSGATSVTYTLSTGCFTTIVASVNPVPPAISGSLTVCTGATTSLTDGTSGGAWASSTAAVGTISGAGVLTGIASGTTTITYTLPTSCFTTAVATVNPSPASIAGSTGLCVGFSTTLSCSTTGGSWTSSNTSVATVSPTSGIVTGIGAGTSVISYSFAGCSSTIVVTVNSLPGAITGTPNVCVGSTTLLSSSTGGGTWGSSNSLVASVDAAGNVTGVSASTATITYSLGSGCITTATVTVNPLPGAIGGTLSICSGATSTLTSSPGGGTWNSSILSTAAIGIGTGTMTGGTAGTTTISYILAPSGCMVTTTATVNALPSVPSGITTMCVGNTTTLTSTPAGGSWVSSNTSHATVGIGTGVVTGIGGGTSIITYTAPITGCTSSTVVTVNAPPSVILGAPTVCQGSTTALTSTPTTGTWSSGNTAIATVAPGTGVVTGVSATPPPGTATITYTLPTTCYTTTTVTVNALPAAITGSTSLCVGLTTTLNTTTVGCTWTSGSSSIATIGVSTGIVNGVTAGTVNMICKVTATGCQRSITVTVNPLPGIISGLPIVCVGATTTLTCTPAGGTWSSFSPGIASINLTTGVVTGGTAGTTIITYTVGSGCTQTTVITVNPLPGAITGVLNFSEGGTTTVNCTPSGGSWSSSNTAIANINSSTGAINSPSCGNAFITYTLPTGCKSTVQVTSNCLPGVIMGTLNVCVGASTTLHCSPVAGTWSSGSTPGVGTVDPVTGVVTGITAGTALITYTLPTLTISTAVVTVNPLPSPISGTITVCEGSTTTLSSSPAGGTWTSNLPANATVAPSTGVVTGVHAGTPVIAYTLPTGCIATQNVVVNQLPAAITGTLSVCQGLTTTLSSATPGGVTWSSGSPNATVGVSTGIVSGVSAGTAIITCYTGSSCTNTAMVTVNPLPASISGNFNVCEGFTTALSTTATGGTWSSSNPSAGTISATGVVAGIAAGTTTITYTLPTTGCIATQVVTVNGNPAPITGSSGFCNFTFTTMSSTTPGLTWSTINPGVASIDPVTGVITGVSVDSTTVIATTAAGCKSSKLVTIIFAPAPITGPTQTCIGSTITLGNIIAGGTWTSTNTVDAPVTYLTGVVSGISAGTTTITYRLSSSICYTTYDVTVNPNPGNITGSLVACEGATTSLSSSPPGGAWSSSNPSVGSVDPSTGIVSGMAGGNATISYILPTTCYATAVVTINPLPAPITGNLNVCVGSSTTLTSTTPGGVWHSSAPGIAYCSGTGMVTGLDQGTATITDALGSGCSLSVVVTVNPVPNPITGAHNVCQNDSIVLYETTIGGVWVSGNPVVASVSATGVVTGMGAGNTLISYELPTGCSATILFTVNGVPANIQGSLAVCAGFATNLTDSTTPGVWTADPLASGVGTIDHLTGVLTGITPGTVNVTYTLGSGCKTSNTVTVILLPAVISGTPQVCVLGTTALSNPIPGGTWSSSNANATVDVASGVVTGMAAGPATITYMVGTGCFNVLHITVNPLPAALTGPSQVCQNASITLATATTGAGTWSSSSLPTATVNSTGVVTGVAAGTTFITYTISATNCEISKEVTVNVAPPAIVGNGYICQESTVPLTDAMTGGVWSSSNPSVAAITTTSTVTPTAVVTPVTLGTATISYTLPVTGCQATKMVTVSPLPVVYNVTGGGTYCAGGNGVPVGLTGSQTGVSYALYDGPLATGYLAGTGLPLNFGLETPAGIYTVLATYAMSGCKRAMVGNADVIITPLTPPVVTLNTGTTDNTSCPGVPVTITPMPTNGGTAPTFIWKVNGLTVSTANTYNYIPANGDVVTVRMTSNGNCISTSTATGSATMTVLPSAIPAVGIAATPGDTVCQYAVVTFNANAQFGGPSPVYRWFVNGADAGTGAAYSYAPVQGDKVSVRMVSDYKCRLADSVMSNDVPLTVDSMIIPHVDVVNDTAANGLATVSGRDVTLKAVAANAGPHPMYQWQVNSVAIPGATNELFTHQYNDYDSVTCTVTSSGVCHNIGTFNWVYLSVWATGVQQVTGASDIALLPNPNRGLFTVRGTLGSTADETLSLEVTDMLGQVVYHSNVQAVQGKINEQVQLTGTLANGMYILNLKSSAETKTFHFVIEE